MRQRETESSRESVGFYHVTRAFAILRKFTMKWTSFNFHKNFMKFAAFGPRRGVFWVMDSGRKKMAYLSVEISTGSPWHLELDIFEKKSVTFPPRDQNNT